MDILERMAYAFWDTALKMAPWLLFGFLAAGLLSLFFTPEYVSRRLGRRAGWRAIVLSVLLGVPLPLCSCGVLPVAVGLRRGGAGKGATAAFLISTPQTGVDSFFATYSLLGWAFALIRPLVAAVTGVLGGFLVDRSDREPPPVPMTARSEAAVAEPWPSRVAGALRYGFGTLFGNVALALLVGLALSALIMAFVPPSFFDAHALGSDWVAFPVMLLVGMPMYVCSTASIPVALALMAKGISPGAALVFLIVGPALNGASLTTLLRLLGRRCTAIHLTVVAVAAVAAGLLLNLAQRLWAVLPDYAAQTAGHCAAGHLPPSALQGLCAVALFALLAWHLVLRPLRRLMGRPKPQSPSARRVTVRGMTCDHCRASVRRLLEGYPGVTRVSQASPEAFDVEGGPLPASLAGDLAGLGYALAEPAAARRVTVRGMTCDHCRASVRRLLEGYPGVTRVSQASPEAFDVEGGPLPASLAGDLAGLGYALAEPAAARRVTVRGMTCDHCRASVRRLLEGYPGVTRVSQASPEAFDVEGGPLPASLAGDLADLGFGLSE